MIVWQMLTAALVGVCVGLILVAVRRLPDRRLAVPVLGLAATGALWGIGDLVTSGARDLTREQIGIAILYTGSIFQPAFWWLLAVRWIEHVGARPGRQLSRLALVPMAWSALLWLLLLTNPWHGGFLTPVLGDKNVYGPIFPWLAVGHTAITLGAAAMILTTIRSREARVRTQARLMVASAMVILVGCWGYILFGDVVPNTTLLVLGVAGTILLFGMYHSGLFGLLPTALPVIFEHDPDGLLLIDDRGLLLHANRAARELLAPVSLAAEAHVGEVLPFLSGREGEGEPREGDPPDGGTTALYAWSAGGTRRWLQVSAHDVGGRRSGSRVRAFRVRDVTREVEAEDEVRRARRLESVAELARGVGHDFNNLLTAVTGHVELLRQDLPEGSAHALRTEKILRVTKRASELAKQLQLHAGGWELRRESLDLNELIGDALDVLEANAGRDVTLTCDLASDPVRVLADATQLRQLLVNLCVNAFEALELGGGRLRLETGHRVVDPSALRGLVLGRSSPAGRYAFLSVTDDGPGMDSRTMERIFEPFFSTKAKGRGTGLATVLGIARAHHALLQAETWADTGSAFTLYLRPEAVLVGVSSRSAA